MLSKCWVNKGMNRVTNFTGRSVTGTSATGPLRSRGDKWPTLWPEQLKEVQSLCPGKAGEIESCSRVLTWKNRGCWGQPGASPGRSYSPRYTWPSASAGTRAAERGMCQPHPPTWLAFLSSASECTCFRLLESLQPKLPRAPIHRLTTSWLWNSNLYPSYLTLNLKALLEYL